MRIILSFLLIISCCQGFSQHTSAELMQKKIAVITKTDYRTGSTDTIRTITYYNLLGQDTATYIDGFVAERKTYRNNKADKPFQRTVFNAAGDTTYKAFYFYKPDGSYSVENTDQAYMLKDIEWYDTKGKKLRSQSPDRNLTTYTYNSKGQLISAKSNGYNDGVKVNITYSYNPKGQLIKKESKGDYPNIELFQYDVKGMLIRSIRTNPEEEGQQSITVYSYQYRK